MKDLSVSVYLNRHDNLLIFVVEDTEEEKIYYMTSYRTYSDSELKELGERYDRFYNYEKGYGAPKNFQVYLNMEKDGYYSGMSDYIRVLSKPFTDKQSGKIDFNGVFKTFFLDDLRSGRIETFVDSMELFSSNPYHEELYDKIFPEH